MKIAIGADHGGYELKEELAAYLKQQGHTVKDFGAYQQKRCDYPPIGEKVARRVASGNYERGILICKSGLGMCMVGNKVAGARAALLHNKNGARSSREHNDANIAVFSGNETGKQKAKDLLRIWLNTPFAGGRHARRLSQIKRIENRK